MNGKAYKTRTQSNATYSIKTKVKVARSLRNVNDLHEFYTVPSSRSFHL